jgi:hypothetical protein
MLDHEKKNRVTRSKVENMMNQVESYRTPSQEEDSSEGRRIDSVQDLDLPQPQPTV